MTGHSTNALRAPGSLVARERLELHGAGALADEELLAILVGVKGVQTAGALLNACGTVQQLAHESTGDLARIKGMTPALSTFIQNSPTCGHRKFPHPWSRLRNSWGLRLGAVINSPGEHPFALDRRLDAGSGGPTAREEKTVGRFRRVGDRPLGHRWVTDAHGAPRGVAGGALVMSPDVRAGRR